MPLDSQTQLLVDQVNNADSPQLYELSIEEARAGLKDMTLAMDAPECEILTTKDQLITGPAGDIPVRIYWPLNAESNKQLPILLLYHGGGFVLGDRDTHHNMSKYYCHHAGLIVVNVDYRLSPEHLFPIGVEDCYTALCWAAENASELGADKNKIAVTGDSAGGNLSAAVSLMAHRRDGPSIAYQALTYPCVDMTPGSTYPSREEFKQGYFLTTQDMKWFSSMYYADVQSEAKDFRSSPIYADDFTGLPPALVITAGYDPLRDEGKAYAECLDKAGVDVRYRCFESTIHGFMSFSGMLDTGREGLDLVTDTLKEYLHNT